VVHYSFVALVIFVDSVWFAAPLLWAAVADFGCRSAALEAARLEIMQIFLNKVRPIRLYR